MIGGLSLLSTTSAAFQHGLGFIPLYKERYDLVIPHEHLDLLQPLLELLPTRAFRRAVSALTGYDTTHTGEQIPI
jgi:putative molybdopterin biosynthesis protein